MKLKIFRSIQVPFRAGFTVVIFKNWSFLICFILWFQYKRWMIRGVPSCCEQPEHIACSAGCIAGCAAELCTKQTVTAGGSVGVAGENLQFLYA